MSNNTPISELRDMALELQRKLQPSEPIDPTNWTRSAIIKYVEHKLNVAALIRQNILAKHVSVYGDKNFKSIYSALEGLYKSFKDETGNIRGTTNEEYDRMVQQLSAKSEVYAAYRPFYPPPEIAVLAPEGFKVKTAEWSYPPWEAV